MEEAELRRIAQKIKEIEEDLQRIEEKIPSEAEEFKALGLIKDGIYKRLEFCIQNLIDIFSIIYASLDLGIPQDLDSIFLGLRQKKIFSEKILSIVEDMKGLRNILVHRYAEIDDELVHALLTENLDDFNVIIKAVENYLHDKSTKK